MIKLALVLFLLKCCVAGVYESVVEKDEHAKKVLADPHGTDEELFESMRSVTDSLYKLIREMRVGKKTSFGPSKKLYERGYPALLGQIFYIEKLENYFKWVESDRRYFYSLYSDVKRKWTTFEGLALQLR